MQTLHDFITEDLDRVRIVESASGEAELAVTIPGRGLRGVKTDTQVRGPLLVVLLEKVRELEARIVELEGGQTKMKRRPA